MKLIEKWFESIRLSFQWDFQEIVNLEKRDRSISNFENILNNKIESVDVDRWTNEILNYNYWNDTLFNSSEIKNKIKEKLYFIEDFHKLYNMIDNLFDNDLFQISDKKIVDRYVKDYSIKFKNFTFRLFQVWFYYNKLKFWYWFIKIDSNFFILLKHNNIKLSAWNIEKLQHIYNLFLTLNSEYLNRIDFYRDFNWSIVDFLKNNKIRNFKTGSLLEWKINIKNELDFSNISTIYRGKKATKRITVRLYNKRLDSISKHKNILYPYINPNLKRFEIEIENREIREIKKYYKSTNIKQLINIIYKNVIHKTYKRNLLKWKEKVMEIVKRFDIDFINNEDTTYLNDIDFLIKKWHKNNNILLKTKIKLLKNFWISMNDIFKDNLWKRFLLLNSQLINIWNLFDESVLYGLKLSDFLHIK